MAATLLLIAIAAASMLLVVGPLSTVARRYVNELRLEAGIDHAPSAGMLPDMTDGDETSIRFPALLERLPQACLALVVIGLTTTWGVINQATAATVVAVPLMAVLCVACTVDAVCHRLPNILLLCAGAWIVGATLMLLIVDLATGASLEAAVWPGLRAILCTISMVAALTVTAMLPSGLGIGDVKLWAVLGLWLGRFALWVPVAGLLLGFFAGGLAAIVFIALRRVGRKDRMAFGPYLVAGAWLSWALAIV
ncbi:MAG: A24 family peptidase [Actinomyces sp.]|uniref:A24 family peptidase n=1 Tax=Actinomyces sp. TaxID=29317 RepID=UPI0026DA96A4|nr:A24 family peptidase [Actinomyces sp.]MDO4242971.1 A24 family peptidase [Actinomyces sp.]